MSRERKKIDEAWFSFCWTSDWSIVRMMREFDLTREQVFYRRQILNLPPRTKRPMVVRSINPLSRS